MGTSIVHVVDSVADEAAGTSYSVPRLCTSLVGQGFDVSLLSIGLPDMRPAAYTHRLHPADFASVPALKRLRISSGLRADLNTLVEQCDLVHTHGLWLMSNLYAFRAAGASRLPLVLSPRGMLGKSALSFSRWKKIGFHHLLQKSALSSVCCIHVTSRQEYDDVRAFGLTQPVAIVPNGMDLVGRSPGKAKAGERRVLLYLGRIHPKKGLTTLLDAWAKLEDQHPNWTLQIAGPNEGGYGDVLRKQVKVLRLTRVQFLGAVFGQDKQDLYKRSDLFVLPTLNENFGLVVAEALACGTPVVCSRGAPWGGLVDHQAGWWVDFGVEPLRQALDSAMQLSARELDRIGSNGRDWMAREFSWGSVARSMAGVYLWLIGEGRIPETVVVD